MPDAFSGFFPGHTAVGLGVGFGEATVEILSLLGGEHKGFIFGRYTVPKLFYEFQALRDRELEEFLAECLRCHDESLPSVSRCSKLRPRV